MKSRFDNWSDVRIFLAVIRMGSTLAASKSLGMAQPTVARRIEVLEHSLRLTLFHKDTRGFHPTPDATALIESAEAMERAALALARQADIQRTRATPIRVTAASMNFAAIFESVMAEFSEANPDIRFEFIATDRMLDLAGGEADVAIRHGQRFDQDNLICRKLRDGSFALYAGRSYARTRALPTCVAEMPGHRFILPEGDRMPPQLIEWMGQHVDPAQVVMTCKDWPALMTAIHSGIGIGAAATSFGDEKDEMIRCFELPEGTGYTTMLLANPQAYQRPEVKTFISFFAPRYAALAKAQQRSAGKAKG